MYPVSFQGGSITPDDFPKLEEIVKCAVKVHKFSFMGLCLIKRFSFFHFYFCVLRTNNRLYDLR